MKHLQKLGLLFSTCMIALTLSGCGGGGGGTSAGVTPAPTTTKARLFTSSWGDNTVRITNDVLTSASPASPALLAGGATGLDISGNARDDLAVDATRNLLYVGGNNSPTIRVWESASTLSGNVTPTRQITISGATAFSYARSPSLDSGRNRLYVTISTAAGERLAIFNNANTRTGVVTPDALVNLGVGVELQWMHIDAANDRLYAVEGSSPRLYVFNNVSSLVTGSVTPSRTITFTGLDLRDLAVDSARNRLYLSDRSGKVWAFANASGLTGTIADPAASAAASWAEGSAMGVIIDDMDRIWWWSDSAKSISMYTNASTLSGSVTKAPDKVVSGVVNNGYGFGIWLY